MGRKIWTRAALLILAVAGLSAAVVSGVSEPIAWRYAHAEAQVLAGVNFRLLHASPEGRKLEGQFRAALGAPLVDSAERLLMSSVYEAGGHRTDLLILSGAYALADLRKVAMNERAQVSQYKGLEIAAPPGARAGDPHLAWLTGRGSGTTVLVGTRPAIQAAADRSQAQLDQLASVNPLFARARALGRDSAIWVTCEGMPYGVGPKSLDAEDIVDGFDIALRVAPDPVLHLQFTTENDDAADAVLTKLRAGGGGSFLLSPWLGALEGQIDGGILSLGAALPPDGVAARVAPVLAAFALPIEAKMEPVRPVAPAPEVRAKVAANVPMTGAPAVVQQPAAPAAPPKPLFVKIQGLDGGVRAIPFPAKP